MDRDGVPAGASTPRRGRRGIIDGRSGRHPHSRIATISTPIDRDGVPAGASPPPPGRRGIIDGKIETISPLSDRDGFLAEAAILREIK